MIVRFCLYSILKNLRFFEPFFVFYLLLERSVGGVGLTYFQIGTLIGYQKLVTGLLEIPSGVLTDRWGRRRALAATFGCYVIAFPLYGISAGVDPSWQIGVLYVAQTLFGIGEALRTGSHKAIMLDWLDETGRGAETTRVIGLTRFFSKSSAAVSALIGGILVLLTGTFGWLFWAATMPAVLGLILILSYPPWLEGEMTRRHPGEPRPRWRDQFVSLWATPGLLFLLLQSILFESQIKLAQHYLQPFLNETFRIRDISVVGGVGALLVGAYYFVQDLLGGTASTLAVPAERRLGGGFRALQIMYVGAAVICGTLAVCLRQGWVAVGLGGFMLLAVLQNARRPVFVSQFNRVMDKPQRATTLSIESQARTLLVAVLAPVTGLAADRYGLPWAFVIIAGILVAGLTLRLLPTGSLGRTERTHSGPDDV